MKETNAPILMLRQITLLTLALPATCVLSGCLVAGVSTGPGGGWFIWPGSFGLIFVLLLLFLLLRRRR